MRLHPSNHRAYGAALFYAQIHDSLDLPTTPPGRDELISIAVGHRPNSPTQTVRLHRPLSLLSDFVSVPGQYEQMVGVLPTVFQHLNAYRRLLDAGLATRIKIPTASDKAWRQAHLLKGSIYSRMDWLEPATFTAIGTGRSRECFEPEWYVRNQTIDSRALSILRNGGRALFVGSGTGVLERFLISAYGVPSSGIVASDLEPHSRIVESDLAFMKLDMLQTPWPDLGGRFDLVVLPQSMSDVSLPPPINGPSRVHSLVPTLQSALDVLQPGGEIRISAQLHWATLQEQARALGTMPRRLGPNAYALA